jgi:hypothetical protein
VATFAQTQSPTPFGLFDSDSQFQSDADKIVVWVKRSLGDDVLSVEINKKQIWSCFEESMLEYGSILNQYQAKSQLYNFLGQPTGSLSGFEQVYPNENLDFLIRWAEPYAMEAGVGGVYDSVSGSIQLESGRQDYDIYRELKDANGDPLFEHPLNPNGGKMKIREVFHFSPTSAYRFFGQTSAANYLANEFSFESFTPETVFYVLPVFEDILRAGQLDVAQRVRRSNYSYQIVGRNIRIFPIPTSDTRKLYMRVQFSPSPTGSLVSYNSSSMSSSGSLYDGSIFGVSNLSNVPFGNLTYSKINSIAKQWIRQYTLARCKEVLGLIRSKFSSVPIPDGDLVLNGSDLVSQGREEKKDLREELKLMLESMTYDKILETNALRAESMVRQLKLIPIPLGGAITTG